MAIADSISSGSSDASSNSSTASSGGDLKEAETRLANMSETMKRLLRAAAELKGEANHQGINQNDEVDQFVLNPYANFYAPGMNTTGKGPLLPPRKKWVDYSMAELAKLLEVLHTEVSDLTSPQSALLSAHNNAITAQLDVLGDSYKLLGERYVDLQSVTKDPPYSNEAITRGTEFIKDGVAGMNECRKRVLHLVQEESKKKGR
jgi:hypothetical protein